MRFTPVNVCAKTYHRPSSSAKFRKYVCPFASNCNFNLPWVRKKPATDFDAMIRANPWPSPSPLLLLIRHIFILCVDDAFVFFGVAVGRGGCSCGRAGFWSGALRRLRRFVHLLG